VEQSPLLVSQYSVNYSWNSSRYSHIYLTGLNWWSGRGKSTWIKGTVSRYSHFHLTGFNWWSGRGKGKQIIGTVSRFSHFRSWLQKKGKGTRVKGTVSRCSHFHYKLASTGGQEGRKARGLKGQCHDIHISAQTQLVVRKGERQADYRDSVTIFKFSLLASKKGERHAD
jgi:hypothetical protein